MNEVKPKILVVDDEPNNHRVYERTLEPLNLQFVKAMSGQEALVFAFKYDFFLILMDVQMPCMDGFETASLLLDHPKTCHIPIIFITAFARDETYEFQGYANGAVDYLVKPINEEIVKSKVSIFLELYQERQELNRVCEIRAKAEEELRVHKDQLEVLVQQRTAALQNSINELTEAQAQLIRSEKMASLGRLVAGIAHELNTPIGICVTSASFLQGKMDALSKVFAEGGMRKKDLANFIDEGPQSTQIILSNLGRACELIDSFKLVAGDVSNDKVRPFKLHVCINRVLRSLAPQTARGEHKVSLEGDRELTIESYPGAISQIITNLVMNSIIHAFDDVVHGHIVIKAVCEKDRVKLTYSDNGKGMGDESTRLIFEPFFTTRRGNGGKGGSGGTGLGMYIVYNLVTQTLHGDIMCTSEVGKGTEFVITFDLKTTQPQQLLVGE
ncbi:MAG: hybrid sensor histidine kinase/response regulator [Algicola sp.]|nr:hybrid sensor histidine kinase/response regulator [Algicola sp.]